VLMGIAERAGIAGRLLARGWPAATPAAMLLGAASAESFTWRGTLRELGDAPIPPERDHLPGTLVVGAVAGLALGAGSPAGEEPAAAAGAS
jgi:uroporphyrin-III C-methyltransferase / precorrin-2 dehydrogenase / sirohydrochlorin ferrochelatase